MIGKKPLSAFTILEITIWLTLIATIALATLILLNPFKQITKGWDGKRINNLSSLQKILESWYNDKNCYPKPDEICYNPQPNSTSCNICGLIKTPDAFKPYLPQLPCDPQHPVKEYLYEVDNVTCPSYYRIYSTLSNSDDPAIVEAGCFSSSCGLPPNYGYDYGVSSPNTGLRISSDFFCYAREETCNHCGAYTSCINPGLSPGCLKFKRFYGSYSKCCAENHLGPLICPKYYCTTAVPSCIQCGHFTECSANLSCLFIFTTLEDCCVGREGYEGCPEE